MMLAPLILLLMIGLAMVPTPPPERDLNQGSLNRGSLNQGSIALAVNQNVVNDPLFEAERARRNGDIDAAVTAYQALLQHPDEGIADEARTRLAGAEFGRGRFAEAASAIEPFNNSPTPALKDRASFLLAEVARTQKDCSTASRLYQRVVSSKALLEPYARMGLIQCAESTDDAAATAQEAQALLDTEPHRRLRIEALEKLAAAELKRGKSDRFLEIHDELYTLGTTRSYRGTLLSTASEVARDAGKRDLAVTKLATLVREYADHPRALAALERLNALQESSAVTWTQAAMVRLNAGQDDAARAGFEAALTESADGAESTVARYNRASLILRQGRETEAAREMRAAAERQPSHPIASVALLRAGRIMESNGGMDEARQIYGRLASVYPESTQGRMGRFRLGLLHYLKRDYSGAITAWEPLAQDTTERQLQALALQWQGKTFREQGNTAESDARLIRAAEVGPDTFGGMRAEAIRQGDMGAQHTFHALSAPAIRGAEADPQLEDWLNAQGTSQAELQDTLTGDPMYRRAIELTRLGLRDRAAWELDALIEQASNHAQPVAHKLLVAKTESELGYTSRALRTAESAAREHGIVRTNLPPTFQRLLMPLAFEDSLAASSRRHSADALLLAALVRQESRFDASARSSANALGLSQIVPGTGQGIASALGYANFTERDLLKPSVNLEFGAYYLTQQLNRYGGLILPALAAYNAGGGPVDKWLNEFGRADMDLFAARIPYNETSIYLQVVYENYGMYRRLYGRVGQ
jgi:soluble lytic murein transglycosylase